MQMYDKCFGKLNHSICFKKLHCLYIVRVCLLWLSIYQTSHIFPPIIFHSAVVFLSLAVPFVTLTLSSLALWTISFLYSKFDYQYWKNEKLLFTSFLRKLIGRSQRSKFCCSLRGARCPWGHGSAAFWSRWGACVWSSCLGRNQSWEPWQFLWTFS